LEFIRQPLVALEFIQNGPYNEPNSKRNGLSLIRFVRKE
jgi:hypothetical protein